MERVTIEDVAKEVGVSINTVSRALNDKPDINSETKKEVLKTVEKMGYRPNKLARGLRSSKTGIIGVIVADIANPFFSALVKGVEKAAKDGGYSILVQDTDETYENEEEAVQTMYAEQVDGILITPVQTEKETIIDLKESGLPFVLLGRHFDGLVVDCVVTDDMQGGFLATEHLIKNGHKNIAIISGPLHISSAKERYEGYKKALNKHKINLGQSLMESGAVTMEDGYNYAKSLISRKPNLTAVFAYSDFVALGVIKAVREAGLRIPEDIAIIGYDDIAFSSCIETPLTSVRIPKRDVAKKAVEILINKIEETGSTLNKLKLDVELVRRSSTNAV